MALKLNEAYPGRFNNPSADYPQGSFKNRTAPDAQDGSYFEQGWANDHLAFLSSLLDAAEVEPNGEVDKVGASQYYDALLQVISENASDNLNAPVATVSASGTINLTTGAPDTSQLAISGTGVNITGFTVAANRFFVVKMTGSNVLVNSASLVTQSNADIVTGSGDTFILRSISDNVVEVMCYAPGTPQSIGYLQQTRNVSGSRSVSTDYTNSTGRPILLSVYAVPAAANVLNLFVNGEVVSQSTVNNATSGANSTLTWLILPGQVYRVTSTFAAIAMWTEVRV